MKSVNDRMSEKRARAEALQAMEEAEVRAYEAGERVEERRDSLRIAEEQYATAVELLRQAEETLSGMIARVAHEMPKTGGSHGS